MSFGQKNTKLLGLGRVWKNVNLKNLLIWIMESICQNLAKDKLSIRLI